MGALLYLGFTRGSKGAAAVGVLLCSVAAGQQGLPTAAPAPTQASSSSSSSSSPSASTPEAGARPAFWKSSDPNAQVTVMENTRLRVISNAPLRSGKTRVGTPVDFLLSENVVVGNVLILPRGATLEGEVMRSKKAGRLKGAADLILELVSLNLGGRRYRVYTYQLSVEGGSKKNPTPAIVGSAEVGALAGAVVSAKNGETTASGKAADIGGGAAAGAGVGTLVSVVTPGPKLNLPAESQMDFYLAAPISVVPVSEQEADRLAKEMPLGGPVLYVRGDAP